MHLSYLPFLLKKEYAIIKSVRDMAPWSLGDWVYGKRKDHIFFNTQGYKEYV